MGWVIEHIGIYARDVERLAKWYQDVLGFKIIRVLEKPGRPPIYFLGYENCGCIIEILPTQKEGKGRELNDPGFSHIGIVVDDFEKAIDHLKSKGVEVFGVRKTSAGWMIGYFRDPEGNILEIVKR